MHVQRVTNTQMQFDNHHSRVSALSKFKGLSWGFAMCAAAAAACVSCQICLEVPVSSSINGQACVETPALVTQLCGPQCEARICLDCLTSHVRISLEPSYAGALPRVPCPICLVPLHKNQWAKFFPSEAIAEPSDGEEETQTKHALVDKYEAQCRRACAVLPPCCHAQDYSQLPPSSAYQSAFEICDVMQELQPFYACNQRIATLWSLCQAFDARKQGARAIVDWLNSDPLETASNVLNLILPRIRDDERRAALLLSFLHVRPNTWTRCCSVAFCFNCKREQHHDTCDDGPETILKDLEYCLLECRHCRAMLFKVEGCSAVTCLCGFALDWDDERWFRYLHTRQLMPVDMFDTDLFVFWNVWSRQLERLRITQAYVRTRAKRVAQALYEHEHVLRKWIGRFIWRCRFSRLVIPQISWAVRKTEIASWVTRHKVLLHRTLGRFAWRRSFSHCVVPAMAQHEQSMRVRWKIAPWRAQLRRLLKEFLWRRRNELTGIDLSK